MLDEIASSGDLAGLLSVLARRRVAFEEVAHWTQGEFHHDLVLRVRDCAALPGRVLVVATNCNGAIKEAMCLAEVPDRGGLWHQRCPDNPEFSGPSPRVLAAKRTRLWFDPCLLLRPDSRSELLPGCRLRQSGGGWQLAEA